MNTSFRSWLLTLLTPLCLSAAEPALPHIDSASGLWARSNLVAWCIVPFDAKRRGPEERAAMLEKLGFKMFAYDYRAEHIPTFDAEMEALKRHKIQLTAWWFPGTLSDEAKLILTVLKRHQLHPQLWITGGGNPTKSPEEQRARVSTEAARVASIAKEAAQIGCTVGLYNHGGWFGEPENQIEIIQELRQQKLTNVGIVYNQHHGHDHVERFATLLQKMKPHLLVLNLNGMTRGGDKNERKILPIGEGELDAGLLRIIRDSGWRGPIGILNHTDEDAEARLQKNLLGLDRLLSVPREGSEEKTLLATRDISDNHVPFNSPGATEPKARHLTIRCSKNSFSAEPLHDQVRSQDGIAALTPLHRRSQATR